ncbi:MAG: protein translocase subunit SecD [Chloroflexaceae bacterium]|nr:protein translocase subunit SecD [Chloroflexaceae bacterium]
MQRQRLSVVLIVVLVAAAIAILTQIPLQLGLDLRGGAQLTIAIEPTSTAQTIQEEDLAAVQRVLENRINALGVSEPIVQTVGGDKILVQLPGVTDPQQAERVLGGTAQLEFRSQQPGTEVIFLSAFEQKRQLEAQLQQRRQAGQATENQAEVAALVSEISTQNQILAGLFESIGLGGTLLEDARPQPTQTGNSWEVTIRFNNEGGQKFAELTKNLAGTGRTIGIFLDEDLISAPSVPAEFATTGITGGQAVITGSFTSETAYDLAVQIRGGSLPFPVAVVENRTVGATLGQDSIRRSIYAGVAGLILVLIFVALYYRLPGLIADVALLIYALLTLACYALIGVTLTLPGIAGFILSIGMAVDANVLIFERTREELRAGKTLYRSVESGFYRAFSSILDSNVTTLIACAALFWLGSGLVKGFALTLAIGVAVSMFTAITCSRTFLLLAVLGFPKLRQKPELFCPNLPVSAKP